MRTVSVYIATSLDGYIAGPNDDLSFLKAVEKEGEDYGYADFIATVDTIVIGRRTYDWVVKEIGSGHYDNGMRDVYVITKTPRPTVGRTQFYNGSPSELIRQLKSVPGKTIYCDGGSAVINELLQHNMIDELTISIIPVLLGDGIRLFGDGRQLQVLTLSASNTFDTGLVQLQYKRKL